MSSAVTRTGISSGTIGQFDYGTTFTFTLPRPWRLGTLCCIVCHDDDCMSVCQLAYKESSGGAGELMTSQRGQSKNSRIVPCFPLHALLVALNQSAVDYLSLDVEGFELEVGWKSASPGAGWGQVREYVAHI